MGQLSSEQIISTLRKAEALLSVTQFSKQIGVVVVTYDRWSEEYGGLKIDQAERLIELEGRNARFKRWPSDARLDKAILKVVASGKYYGQRSGVTQSSRSAKCPPPFASCSDGRVSGWGGVARPNAVR
jgi:hypothetical protein